MKAARAVAAAEVEVSIAAVARVAGVSWPTANRHLGGQSGLLALLDAPPKPPVSPSSRERLIAAFARCVGRAGVEGAALDDVSIEAGVTKGSLYWHFDTKAELMQALIEARPQPEGAPTLTSWVARHAERPAVDADLDVELAAAARKESVRRSLADTRRQLKARLKRELGLGSSAEATVILALLDGLSVARRVDGEPDVKALTTALRALLRLP